MGTSLTLRQDSQSNKFLKKATATAQQNPTLATFADAIQCIIH